MNEYSVPDRRAAQRLALAALALLAAAWQPGPSSGEGKPATPHVSAAAPLGTVISVPVTIDNFGAPAVEARLYEGLEPTLGQAERAPGPLRVALPEAPGPIAPALAAELRAAPGGPVAMIVYLAEQADLSSAAAVTGWEARGAAVVAALQATASATQKPLLAALRAQGYAPQPYWIVNAIAVSGGAGLAGWLSEQAAVALVAPNSLHQLDLGMPSAAPDGEGLPAWGVQQISAPVVWADWGVRGAGIVAANIDTGVAYSHPALLTRYRGWSAAGVTHDYHWFDAAGEPPASAPVDLAGHGTHTMGTIAGGPAAEYAGLGVAPEARWIAARACEGMFCADQDLIEAAQWLLAPTDLAGNTPRPDLRPHVINNSWGKLGTDAWYQGYVTAWNAAGIFSVFAAGNSGTFEGCGSSSAPANYVESFAVGATDATDTIADFSSRGPTADGRLKPELSAPGVAVPSAWPDGSVRTQNGTSMATPHVAGLAALLWSANPTLIGDLASTHRVLTSTAVPRPTPECGPGLATVPNNVYGWGRIDARAAVEAARVDVPWLAIPPLVSLPANGSTTIEMVLDGRQVSAPGTYVARLLVVRAGALLPIPIEFAVLPASNTAPVQGRLTDYWQGSGVYGRVLIDAGPQVQTDPSGHFTATLPYGIYTLTATATGYHGASTSLSLAGAARIDLVLVPDLPHLQSSPAPISAELAFGEHVQAPITLTNAGTQPLSVTATVVPLEWITDVAGEPGATLYDLSATLPLSLSDDLIHPEPFPLGFAMPMFGGQINQVYVSSNGWVSASRPRSAAPLASCLPSGGLPPDSLAPFWADLDPSEGGAVRAAHLDSDTFVVSFEEVPPWQQTPATDTPTYTFQLVLRSNGQIEFRYGAMGALPARWSAGMAFDDTRGQRLACYRTPVELDHRLWRLHNQPAPGVWLTVEPSHLSLAPGATGNMATRLAGLGYAPWHPGPMSGVVRLTTNDPSQPLLDVPITVTVGAPPYSFWYPLVGK